MRIARLEDVDPHAFMEAVLTNLEHFASAPIRPEIKAIVAATDPAALLEFFFNHCGKPFFEMSIGGEVIRFADPRVFDGRTAGNA